MVGSFRRTAGGDERIANARGTGTQGGVGEHARDRLAQLGSLDAAELEALGAKS